MRFLEDVFGYWNMCGLDFAPNEYANGNFKDTTRFILKSALCDSQHIFIPNILVSFEKFIANKKLQSCDLDSQKKHLGLKDYLESVVVNGVIPTRKDSLHDFFNFLSWVLYYDLKQSLAELAYQKLQENEWKRCPVVDGITMFDEGGSFFINSSKEHSRLAILQSKCTEQKVEILKSNSFAIFGHGLMEHLCYSEKTVFSMSPELMLNRNYVTEIASLDFAKRNQFGSIPISRSLLHRVV